MNKITEPGLVKITEVFLVPSSFLVAALGTADSNPHRAGVSLIGLIVSILWSVCSSEALAEQMQAEEAAGRSRRVQIMAWLSVLFIICWTVSLVVHLILWSKPLGH